MIPPCHVKDSRHGAMTSWLHAVMNCVLVRFSAMAMTFYIYKGNLHLQIYKINI